MSRKQTIKVTPFLKPYKSEKDGKHQLMMRIKVGSSQLGKVIWMNPIDIKILSQGEEDIRITSEEFANRKSNNSLIYRIYEVEGMVRGAIQRLTLQKKVINTKTLFQETYQPQPQTQSSDKLIDNEDTRKFFDYPVPEKVWKDFSSTVHIDTDTNEPVLWDDLEDIAKGFESEYYADKAREEIEKMHYLERYELGHYDKENIFDCFGFCWTLNPKNNDMLIPKSYKSLLLRLHDFRYNQNPSERVSEFNDDWITGFLKFLVNEGYSSHHPKNYHPFGFDKHRAKLINSERNPYRFSAFEKNVKHLKRYIFLLQKYKIIPYDRNTKFIDAKDYISRDVNTTSYTRREHSLTQEEFDLLCNTDFQDPKLNTARDMFVLAVLGGGFRGEEFYNHELSLQNHNGKYLLYIYHSKTDSENVNPVFGALKEVITRNNGQLPEFLPRIELRDALSKIAVKLNFNRIIYSPDTFLDSKNKRLKDNLKDIFSIYFARKTLVAIFDSLGMPDDFIMPFTSHSKRETLKYYKPEQSLAKKIKILDKMGLW
jgi:hypothetical protein